MFRDNIPTYTWSFGVFSSFEYAPFKMEIKQSSILYITIYKPPQNCFDFTELLSIALLLTLVITEDLDVHVDVAQDKQAKELTAVLEMLSLTRRVTEPSHSRGHTLDVLITKGCCYFKYGGRRCCFI